MRHKKITSESIYRTDAEASNTRRGFLVWIGTFELTERTPGI